MGSRSLLLENVNENSIGNVLEFESNISKKEIKESHERNPPTFALPSSPSRIYRNIPKSTNNSPISDVKARQSVKQSSSKQKDMSANIASTLPRHSPHSPLLTHPKNQPHNKLSARYINNKATRSEDEQRYCMQVTEKVCSNFSQQNENQGFEKVSDNHGNILLMKNNSDNSKKKCSIDYTKPCACSKENHSAKPSNETMNNDKKCTDSSTNTCYVFRNAKRVITTRNAATSPNLGARKLDSTLKLFTANELRALNKPVLEKSSSFGDSKSQKKLRTARSLSPKPPTRLDQSTAFTDTLVTSDSKPKFITCNVAAKIDFEKCEESKLELSCKKTISKNSSPIPIRVSQTSSLVSNNRTNSKGSEITDPWLKITPSNSKNNIFKEELVLQKEDLRQQKCTKSETNDYTNNPWIKRNKLCAQSKKRFREAKSLSTTKFEDEYLSEGQKCQFGHRFQHSQSSIHCGENFLIGSIPLQSAPSSPNYLTAPENPFVSTMTLSFPSSNAQDSILSMRSASFSPARSNDLQKFFVEPEISTSKNSKFLFGSTDRSRNSFLNVNNSTFQCRHSFSSISNKLTEDELQLNIRRLSEQMKKSSKSFTSSPKQSLNETITCYSKTASQIKAKADFTDYLKQFRYSEAKKFEESTNATIGSHEIKPSKTNQNSQVQVDTMLETTC